MDDSRIVELFWQRSEEGIRCAAQKYGRRLYALALGIVQDIQTAEECENDTWQQAWNSIPPHSPKDYLYAFLARITRHIALNRCRDRARLKRNAFICQLSDELQQCIPAPDNCACRLEDAELSAAINDFLAKLDAEKRVVFLRRYWYMESVADIAIRFGCSEGRIKTMLHRCRTALRTHLEKEGYTL